MSQIKTKYIGDSQITTAKLAAKTGTGNVVLSDSPTMTGTIGAASATFSGTVNKLTLTQPATGATLTIPDGATATAPTGTNTLQSSLRTFNNQTGTTYTFALADGSGPGLSPLNTFSNASPITVTVPPNSSVAFPIGTQIDCVQEGAGTVTFAEGSGVTIHSDSGNKSIGNRYVGVTLIKTATDTWYLLGNLTA